jgi:hypothetical protein
MILMNRPRRFPDPNRLSVLAAVIMLAYALARFVNIPAREIAMQLPGIYMVYSLNFRTIVSILVAALAAAGTQWLLRDHPANLAAESAGLVQPISLGELFKGFSLRKLAGVVRFPGFQHWILPSLTAWAIGIPLNNLQTSLQWWIVFALGGVLLMLVLAAEYVVVDITDIRHPFASAGLTAVTFAMFLMLAIAVREAGMRLYLLLPSIVLASGLITLRSLYLRLGGTWAFAWSMGIAIVTGQLAIGLHYLPVSPMRYGLLLLAPLYGLTSLAGTIQEGRQLPRLLVEPLSMFLVLFIFALWIH